MGCIAASDTRADWRKGWPGRCLRYASTRCGREPSPAHQLGHARRHADAADGDADPAPDHLQAEQATRPWKIFAQGAGRVPTPPRRSNVVLPSRAAAPGVVVRSPRTMAGPPQYRPIPNDAGMESSTLEALMVTAGGRGGTRLCTPAAPLSAHTNWLKLARALDGRLHLLLVRRAGLSSRLANPARPSSRAR